MEQSTLSTFIESSKFTEFCDIAEDFCAFIEDGLTITSPDYLQELQTKLLLLYNKAMDLPWVDLKIAANFEQKMNNSYFEKILKSIAHNLQDKRYYWDVSNPSGRATKNEAITCDMVDCIGDIYKSLKYSLNIYHSDTPDSKEVAIWQFKFDFEYQWSSKCINAIRAIHFNLV